MITAEELNDKYFNTKELKVLTDEEAVQEWLETIEPMIIEKSEQGQRELTIKSFNDDNIRNKLIKELKTFGYKCKCKVRDANNQYAGNSSTDLIIKWYNT